MVERLVRNEPPLFSLHWSHLTIKPVGCSLEHRVELAARWPNPNSSQIAKRIFNHAIRPDEGFCTWSSSTWNLNCNNAALHEAFRSHLKRERRNRKFPDPRWKLQPPAVFHESHDRVRNLGWTRWLHASWNLRSSDAGTTRSRQLSCCGRTRSGMRRRSRPSCRHQERDSI